MLFIENCSHILCKEWLWEIAEKEYGQMQNIGWPKWKATILDAELQMALGEDKYGTSKLLLAFGNYKI